MNVGGQLVVVVGLVALCGGCDRLNYEALAWSVTLTGPLNDAGQAELCPMLATQAQSAAFLPPQSATAVITTADEDVYDVRRIIIDGVGDGTPSHLVLGTELSFDMGPSGTPYDADELVPTVFNRRGGGEPITATRAIVGGNRGSDDKVELHIELAPDCDGETIEAGGESCTCAPQRFVWAFEAQG